MSDNKWTPEPWSNSPLAKPNIIITDKDWFRAVECVNALAGVENPKEYIETILKQREELAEQVKKLTVLCKSNLDLL